MKSIADYFFSLIFTKYFEWNNDSIYEIDNSIVCFSSITPRSKIVSPFLSVLQFDVLIETQKVSSVSISFPDDIENKSIVFQCTSCDIAIKSNKESNSNPFCIGKGDAIIPNVIIDSHSELNKQISQLEWETLQKTIESKLAIKYDRIHYDILPLPDMNDNKISFELREVIYCFDSIQDEDNSHVLLIKMRLICDAFISNDNDNKDKCINLLKGAEIEIIFNEIKMSHNTIKVVSDELVLNISLKESIKLAKVVYSIMNTIRSFFSVTLEIKAIENNISLDKSNLSLVANDVRLFNDYNAPFPSFQFKRMTIELIPKAFASKLVFTIKKNNCNTFRVFIRENNILTKEKHKITSESFTLSISKSDNDTTAIVINFLTLSLSFELLLNLISLFKENQLASIISQSFAHISSLYSFSITIPVIQTHLGTRLQFIGKAILSPLFTFQIDSFSYKSKCFPLSTNKTINAFLTVKLINPIFQTIDSLISDMKITYDLKSIKHLFNISNCSLSINSLVINAIDNILNNQLAFYPTIQNSTSNVLELSFFNESFSFFLPPEMKSHIIHRSVTLKLSINDIEYKSTIDISKLFKHYFNKQLYHNNKTPINKGNYANNEIVYYTQIELRSNQHQKKRLTLMYLINKANLLMMHLIIFDSLIVIRKFPSFNVLNFIIAKSNDISSIERTTETNNGIIVELKQNEDYNDNLSLFTSLSSKPLTQAKFLSPAISFECDNCLFCNYFLQEIDVIIDYNSNTQSHHIQGRSELSISINFKSVQSIKLSIKYNDIIYSSNNILKTLSTVNSIQSIDLFSFSKTGLSEQSTLSFNISIEDFISSPLISNVIKQDINYSKYSMKIIKLLPHVLLRNFTSSKGFSFSFIHNSASTLINQKTLSLIESNSNDKIESNTLLVEINQNRSYVTNKECSFILHDKSVQNSISSFALNKIVFIIQFDSIGTLYFSEVIHITKSDKDIIFPIEICPNYYFFFRMRTRYVNDGILSLTLSSFLNINRKGTIGNVLIKNKIELPQFEMYSNGLISNDSDEISYDTIFKVDDRLSEISLNDVFAFYGFVKEIENTLEMFIDKNYNSPLTIIDLFIKDSYQLCCFYQGTDINRDKEKKMSKVYHIRMLHNPFLICEIYDAFVNLSQCWYLFIDNQLESDNDKGKGKEKEKEMNVSSLYYHTENTKEINDISLKKGEYEINIKEKPRTLIITINSKNYSLIKDNIIMIDRVINDNNVIITCEMLMNTYRIVIKDHKQTNNDEKKSIDNQSQLSPNFSFTFTNIMLKVNILPFFIYTHKESKLNYELICSTDKLLMNYIPNQTLNFSFPNLKISKGSLQLFSTSFLSDIKIDSIPLHSPSLKLYYNEYRINLSYQMSMTIDDNSIQCLNFFLSQLNSNKKQHSPVSTSSFSPKLNILNSISLSPLAPIYMINEIKVNDFSINMNIEYKKGLNFTIKNSTIIHKYVQMKNIIGTSKEVYQNLKNNLMSSFFRNMYSLMSSTEIFGNWNDFMKSIRTGYREFRERPFSFGIINLVYASVKGGVNSFLGIGRSLAKTLRHIQSGNYNFEIYHQYNALVNKDNEIKTNDGLSVIALCYEIISNQIEEEYNVDFCFIVDYNKNELLLIDNKFYFILVSNSVEKQLKTRIELLIPYYKIQHVTMIGNDYDDKRIVTLKMNKCDKEFIFEFKNSFEKHYFYNSVLNKFL